MDSSVGRSVFLSASVLAAVIVVAGAAGDLLGWEGFLYKLRLDTELSVPAWYSSLLMFSAGALAFSISAAERRAGLRTANGWFAVAVLFFYFSLDEMVSIHEHFADGIPDLGPANALGVFRWVVVGLALVVIVGALFVPFLLRLPRRTALLLFVGGAVFVTGAVGFELLGAYAEISAGFRTFLYYVITSLEEALELAGVLITIYAMMKYRESWTVAAQPFATSAANASNSG